MISIILSDDFNLDLTKKESKSLKQIPFVKEISGLQLKTSTFSTIRGKSALDFIFAWYVNKIDSEYYVSYFNNYKPVLTINN